MLFLAVKVLFAVNQGQNKAALEPKSTDVDVAPSTCEKSIKSNCFDELLEKCRNISTEKNITLASVMHIEALKQMSNLLPVTEQEIMQIPHVTKANYEKYGKSLLEITTKYACKYKRKKSENIHTQENATPEDAKLKN